MRDGKTKEVLKHIKSDSKEFKSQLSDDKKLAKSLKRGKNAKRNEKT